MQIPEWLKRRPTQSNISSIICNFSKNFEIQSFSEISVDYLSQHHRIISKSEFFKLLRVLGIYGVYFYKRLSTYSSIAEEYPEVMTIPEKYWNYHFPTFIDNPELLRIIESCGLKHIGCLHGVPKTNYLRLVKGSINNENLALFNPIEITKISKDFFTNKPQVLEANFDKCKSKITILTTTLETNPSILNGIHSKSVHEFDFSIRVQNCLKNAHIKTIGELQKLTESDLLQIQNLGITSVIEIKKKLKQLEIKDKLKQIDAEPTDTEVSNQAIAKLNFSLRVQNCLKWADVNTIGELVNLTESDLLSIPNMGKTSVTEIKNKLKNLGISLHMVSGKSIKVKKIDLSNKQIISILRARLDEFLLEDKHIKRLKKENIEYVWQLVQLTTDELKMFKGIGNKFISDIEKKVCESSLSFGLYFSDGDLEKLKQNESVTSQNIEHVEIPKNWFKNTALKFASNKYEFLDDRERKVAFTRIIIEKKRRMTLEDLGTCFGVSRERVRQIEKKAKNKIKRNIPVGIGPVFRAFENMLFQLGWLTNFESIESSLCELSDFDKGIIDAIILEKKKTIEFDWQFSLVLRKDKISIESVFSAIETELLKTNGHEFYFSDQDLYQAAKTAAIRHSIFKGQTLNNLIAKFSFEKQIIRNKNNNQLYFRKNVRQNKLAQLFKDLYPNGTHIYKNQNLIYEQIQRSDPELFDFPNARAMIARITDHKNILLWDRGFFIHEDHLNIDSALIKEIETWIINYFDRGCHRFQVRVPYARFEQQLTYSNIPTLYSLYTLLRIQNNERIGLLRFPTIVDMEKVHNPEKGRIEELESFFEDTKQAIPYKDVYKEFVEKRGWSLTSLQQTINCDSELVFPWKDNTYIHLDYLNVNYDRLQNLIEKLREKLYTINAPYNLKGAKNEMALLWEQACPSAETRTIIKLIRQTEPDDLLIERNFVRFIDAPPESTSTLVSLEEFILDKNEDVSRFEIKEEFSKKRGWTDLQIYNAIRNANLFQSGDSSFIHPAIINWSDDLSQEVHSILSEHLKRRNAENQPHMQIEALIYEFVLPELPNDIQWTSELLKSVGNEFQDLIFFDDAYIFVDNDFDIEDLDDMIAYLLANNFDIGLAPIKKIEKILYREGILRSSRKIPNDQFFEGSCISLLAASGEISLSEVGKKKYAKK